MFQQALDDHLERVTADDRSYDYHKRQAINNPDTHMSMCIDGMDQLKTAVPHRTRWPAMAKSYENLGLSIIGVRSHGHVPKAMVFHHPKWFPHDSNLTNTVFLLAL